MPHPHSRSRTRAIVLTGLATLALVVSGPLSAATTWQQLVNQTIASKQVAPKAPDWEVFCGDPVKGYASSGLAIRLSVPVVLVPDLYPWTAVGSARLAGEICDLVWDAVDRR